MACAAAPILATLFIQPAYSATVTFYNDESAFMAATTTTLIDFEGIVGDNVYSSLVSSMVVDGVTFSVSSGELAVSGKNAAVAGTPYDSALLFSNNAAPITADLTSAGTSFTAVGGFFGDIDSAGSPTTMTLIGSSGVLDTRTLTTADMGAGIASNFFGWTVTGDTIRTLTHNLNGSFEGIDDFRYGGTSEVPVPAAIWLFSSGLLGLIGIAKRKNA